MAKKPATPREVREHFGLPTNVKGRLPEGKAEEFTKATGRKVESVRPFSSVVVKVKAQDSAGRNITRKLTVPTSEARTILGDPAGKRGRIGNDAMATLVAHYQALQA